MSSHVDALREALQARHRSEPFDYVATCGSNRLMLLAQRLAEEWAIPGEVALEQQMGCALGMCFCCVRPFRSAEGGTTYRRVCWEGPVFKLSEAITWQI
jgi:dihydroorotate dehydrogenase electron transfer subunit